MEIVKYLVENGADVNEKGFENETALMYASENGHLEMVKYLVEYGADVNANNQSNKTAFVLASEKGHLEIVKYLIKNGAYFNSKDKNEALLRGSFNGHFEMVKYLVEQGADVNAKDTFNCTSYKYTSNFNNSEKTNAKKCDKDNKTALLFASIGGHLDIVKNLVENGADVNAKDKYKKQH